MNLLYYTKNFFFDSFRLDYAPEPWTPPKCAYLLKYMAGCLPGTALICKWVTPWPNLEKMLSKICSRTIRKIWTLWYPKGTPWNFTPLKMKVPQQIFTPKAVSEIPAFETNPANGSNNWAVSGSKTSSGYPIFSQWSSFRNESAFHLVWSSTCERIG